MLFGVVFATRDNDNQDFCIVPVYTILFFVTGAQNKVIWNHSAVLTENINKVDSILCLSRFKRIIVIIEYGLFTILLSELARMYTTSGSSCGSMEKTNSESWFDQGGGDGYDAVVVGSGYGGSVAACRLSMAGFKVCLLEKGRRWEGQDFPTDSWKILSSVRVEKRGVKIGPKDALFQVIFLISHDFMVSCIVNLLLRFHVRGFKHS